ncbi:HEAT repeat domain-containing protein [Anabaena catenula]|uniref:HEAT repeat domain-containing protein n=1 Tax=Anabaena catenula FACHB-362 TaxID=2692877 RepID=A0ABR8IYH0_9NOST|nr:HEAT repeat domain-containing protein [Anabaena catenula]MBD2691112.1 HEAT repeat domain-containing protein [Anabaena catenula FACHB-362]
MSIDFQRYLESICSKYQQWWSLVDKLTNTVGCQKADGEKLSSLFDFGLMAQIIEPRKRQNEISEKIERLSVLEGLRKYAAKESVLLIGRPGAGKSTTLARLLVESAKEALQNQQSQIPVLVELRYYKDYYETSVLDLVQAFLERHELYDLSISELKKLLKEKRFLLLMDGINELPDDDARRKIKLFRRDNSNTPMIFTTRDGGDDLGIGKKLEMQPLSNCEVQRFIDDCMPGQTREILQQLRDRLRELGQTPLVMWMLYFIFQKTQDVPLSSGEALRKFTQLYERNSNDVPVSEECRLWRSGLLEHLAFEMMQADKPTDFRLSISERDAKKNFTEFLQGKEEYPERSAIICLDDLLKHHLIQRNPQNDEIEFCHQLLQEYYAAESLLRQLDQISPENLKYFYLNYLKWTEPLLLMLALPEVTDKKAVEIVSLGLDVDLHLGAKLAGAVKSDYQKNTVILVDKLNIDHQLKILLLGLTRSTSMIPIVSKYLNNANPGFRKKVIESFDRIECEEATQILYQVLKDENYDVNRTAAIILGKRGDQAAIPILIDALEDKNFSDYFWVSYALKKISTKTLISAIQKVIKHGDAEVRKKAIETLYPNQVNSLEAVNILIECLKDTDSNVRNSAAFRLGLIDNKKAVLPLVESLIDESFSVRTTICISLKKIDSNAAVSYITQILWDKNSNSHIQIAEPYLQIGNSKILQDSRSNFCQKYIEALGFIGNDNAIPTLIYALYDENMNIYSYAAIALGKIGNKAAISALIHALKNVYFGVRNIAAYVLGDFDSDEVISALIMTLKDECYLVRESVTVALDKIRIKQDETLDTQSEDITELEGNDQAIVLSLALKSQDIIPFGNAIDEIEKYSYNVAIPELFKALEREDTSIRWMAASAIGKTGNTELLPRLSELLVRTGDEPLSAAIFGIQERCKYYNYIIATSPLLEEENNTDSLANSINTLTHTIKTMSENSQASKYSFPNATTVQIVENNNGEVIAHKYAAHQKQNIAEVETVIQKLLEQIEQNKPTPIEAELIVNQAVDNHPVLKDKQVIEQAIKNYPNLKIRLRRVATAVGIETVKVIFAPAGILIEGVKAWTQPE